MNKQDVYEKIVGWEREHGESFLDRFDGYLRAGSFMFWSLGRGYIDKERFALWEADYNADELEADDANYYIMNDEVPYALVDLAPGDYDEAKYEKAYEIVAEFISESPTYLERLDEFLNE